ncbi:uncharacterized protein LOC133869179 [Alnus glutinosa]|uniref:uncharacterized protein LOC133869179 n=1 Tax=Alnus glutinosa TaxID=3517 RepID=UPI002D765250|nr:uncharacterized protein LOC133869179 [Alnus glutinosa]
MYVSLAACKEGFLAGCRPMICVDACFIKTKRGGQLHAAIARDGNDDIYPIAYAVCETENKDTWTWFLVQLLEDIGYPQEHMWSFMSDRQKGLIDALEDLMPGLEHRYCVRHLYANMKGKGWKGKKFKDALWGATPNKVQFKYYLVIGEMDKKALEYTERVDPKMWSRHAFRTTSCSDILLNNIVESFNAWIVKKLERNKLEAKNYICRWSNQMQFEVDNAHEPQRVVDLQRQTCGCGRWQLNGIPYPHAVCAIYLNKGKPETYVGHWYMMDTYRKSYASGGVEPIEPLQPKKQRGRPKKQRQRGVDEQLDESIKVSRKGYDVRCGNCGEKGHNARSCHKPDNPNRKKYPKQPKKPKGSTSNACPSRAGPSGAGTPDEGAGPSAPASPSGADPSAPTGPLGAGPFAPADPPGQLARTRRRQRIPQGTSIH